MLLRAGLVSLALCAIGCGTTPVKQIRPVPPPAPRHFPRNDSCGAPHDLCIRDALVQPSTATVFPVSTNIFASGTDVVVKSNQDSARRVDAASAVVPVVVNRTLCTLAEVATIHVKLATQFYASRYPGINWGFKWVGGTWWPSAREAARWWAIQGNTECDGLIGPGWSSAAIAMSPLVDTAWIDPSSTAAELSYKAKHNTFSRDVPTDAIGAALVSEVMSSLGWTKANVFCADDTYGRSLFNKFKDTWTGLNNTLDTTLCLPSDATDEAIAAAAEQFVKANTRTLYLIFRESDQSGLKMLERLRPYATTMNLVLSESLCDLRPAMSLHSGLCLYYYKNDSIVSDYLTYYRATNFTPIIEELQALGGKPDDVKLVTHQESGYSMFIHDATHHMMKAMHEHKASGSTEKLYKYLRTVVSVGATGTIRLDERGDRIAVDAKVVNLYHDKTGTFTVGFVRDGKYEPVNGTATMYSFLGNEPSTSHPIRSLPHRPRRTIPCP